MSVVTPKFQQAMASARARKRELLVRLLQKEEMKDAMFKELQIKHGSGFAPSKEIEEKTGQAVDELLSNNPAFGGNNVGNGDADDNNANSNGNSMVEEKESKSDENMKQVRRPVVAKRPSSGTRRRPSSAASSRSIPRSNASGLRSRPQSARISRPNSSRSNRGRPLSADSRRGRRTPRQQYEFSPIRSALTKLYNTTAHLMPKDSKPKVRKRPQSARSVGSRGADSARSIAASIKKNGEKRPQSARGPRKFKLGEHVEARSHSRNEYRPANIIKMHSDGTVDVEFGDPNKKKRTRYDQIPSIGLKRVKEVVKHKVEQRVRGASTGKWATVNPHVLKSFFKLFDPTGNGELPREKFAAALREKLGLENISTRDMNALMDEYDADGDGQITYEEFSAQVLPKDFHEGRGIIDFPHGNPQGDAMDQLPHLVKQIKIYLEQQKNMREAFRKMGGAGDGTVDLYEFKACLRNANLGHGMDKAVDILFKQIDKDGSGAIDFDEFASELNKNTENTTSNFFIGGGRERKKKKSYVQKVGVKRLQNMVLDKLEQKAKGTATGQWAMTSPHILKKFFKEFDEDESGELDLQEFTNAVRWKLGLMNVHEDDIKDLFKLFDKRHVGAISYDEFVEKTMPKEFVFGGGGIMDFPGDHPHLSQDLSVREQVQKLKHELKTKVMAAAKNMREVFRRVGGAGDGEIDKYEFKACLRQQHLGIGQEKVVDALFKQIDKDGSGHITFDEFASVLNKDEENHDSNFFIGGGKKKRSTPGQSVPSIGARAVMEILKDKIEQRVRGRSTGAFATVNPHILRSMFMSFCSDGSSELTHEEFAEAMRFKLGLLNISPKDLEAVAKLFDKDGDGSIDFDEFVAVVLPPEIVNGNGGIMDWEGENGVAYGSPTEKLKELKKKVRKYLDQHKNMRNVFRKMASGGNGEVTKYEFKACLRNSGVSHGLDKAAEMLFAEIDKDSSGTINFDEFCTALNSNEQQEEGNFFIGGGRAAKGKARVKVASIGVKRLKEVLKVKIEQKCKGRSTGAFARTSAHQLKKIFHEFDTDGGGTLSYDEFKEALRTRLGLMNVSDKDLDALTKEFDKDGDGDISYDEFIKEVMPVEISRGGGGIMDFPDDDPNAKGSDRDKFARLKKDVKKKVVGMADNFRKAFRKMGGSGDGKIDKYEFRTALRNLNLGLGIPNIVDKLFHEIDSDGSGSVTFQEFADAMKTHQDGSEGPVIARKIKMGYIRHIEQNTKTTTNEPKINIPKLNISQSNDESKKEQKANDIQPSSKREEYQNLRPRSFRRPKTPRDLLREAAKKAKQSNNSIPVRPQSGKRPRSGRSRPRSSGRQLSQTVGIPMQMSRKPRWGGAYGKKVGRSAPNRLVKRRKPKSTIVEELKRRYMEEARKSGILMQGGIKSQRRNFDLSGLLGVKKL